jgi:ABC-type transport system involved in multi-copper enzyme maturation permease subunit
MVENLLIISISTMTAIPIFVVMELINSEKNDKVFEQIFMVPLSPLKTVLYHFIALTILIILSIGMGYTIITVAMIIIMGNAHISIVRGFVSSLLLALPLCYVILLNSMLMPSKYSPLLSMFLLLMTFLPMQGYSACSARALDFSRLSFSRSSLPQPS